MALEHNRNHSLGCHAFETTMEARSKGCATIWGMNLPERPQVLAWCADCGQEAPVAPVIRFADGSYGGPCIKCWQKFEYSRFMHQTEQGMLASWQDRRTIQ